MCRLTRKPKNRHQTVHTFDTPVNSYLCNCKEKDSNISTCIRPCIHTYMHACIRKFDATYKSSGYIIKGKNPRINLIIQIWSGWPPNQIKHQRTTKHTYSTQAGPLTQRLLYRNTRTRQSSTLNTKVMASGKWLGGPVLCTWVVSLRGQLVRYIYMYLYTYAHTHKHVCVFVCHTRTQSQTHIYIHACTCVGVCLYGVGVIDVYSGPSRSHNVQKNDLKYWSELVVNFLKERGRFLISLVHTYIHPHKRTRIIAHTHTHAHTLSHTLSCALSLSRARSLSLPISLSHSVSLSLSLPVSLPRSLSLSLSLSLLRFFSFSLFFFFVSGKEKAKFSPLIASIDESALHVMHVMLYYCYGVATISRLFRAPSGWVQMRGKQKGGGVHTGDKYLRQTLNFESKNRINSRIFSQNLDKLLELGPQTSPPPHLYLPWWRAAASARCASPLRAQIICLFCRI